MNWSASKVRSMLPSVEVQFGKARLMGRVTGRANRLATVTVDYIGNPGWKRLTPGTDPWRDFHYTWEAIAESLNTGKPLGAYPD